MTGIQVPEKMVGVALAAWAGLVAPAAPAAFGTSCMTAGGGAEGKPCICSPTSMFHWRKAWLMSGRLAELGFYGDVENGA